VKEPTATFSPCFGGPFLVWHPSKYAELLAAKMRQHQTRLWLVNTGWSGGGYGAGNRIKLAHSRAIIDAIHSGQLVGARRQRHPTFGFDVPTECPGVPTEMLWPRDTWSDSTAYDLAAHKLAGLFVDNFKTYQDRVSDEVFTASPVA
jgi:phosphoenolpyruvate carboxykinase (ATP)